ncbi:hypothetical protein GCM10010416_18400 [Streptomyces caniferus]
MRKARPRAHHPARPVLSSRRSPADLPLSVRAALCAHELTGDPRVAFLWQTVVYRGFDVELDEPGRRSGAALETLMTDLGTPAEAEGFALVGEWAEALSRTLTAGLPALLALLSHPDTTVRRILPLVFAYADAPTEEVVPALLARSESDPAPVRLGLLFALALHCDIPEVRDHLRRRMRGEPADALGAAFGLLLPPVPECDDGVIDEALDRGLVPTPAPGPALTPDPAPTPTGAKCSREPSGRSPGAAIPAVCPPSGSGSGRAPCTPVCYGRRRTRPTSCGRTSGHVSATTCRPARSAPC